ncbi:MAG: hypothetical protein ABFE01_01400, partial [Phycisphaerales bacterium]
RVNLLPALEQYHNATRRWSQHYARFVNLEGRIQEMGEFCMDDDVEGILMDRPSVTPSTRGKSCDRHPVRIGPRQRS